MSIHIEGEEFFLALNNPGARAVKLFSEVFNRMAASDDISRQVIGNIGELSSYNISFVDVDADDELDNVFSEDDLSSIRVAISSIGTQYSTCHEFGHLLLDIFARGELPDNYKAVNRLCVQRLKKRRKQVANVLKAYTTYAWGIFNSDATPLEHLTKHPEEVCKYLAENPEKTSVDLGNEVLINHFAMLSASDEKLREYNRAANIIDAMFHGDNPFLEHYGNKSLFPALSMHSKEYFTGDDRGACVAGFEEQFCEYLTLRVYGDEMSDTVNRLRDFIGDEWFSMMDGFYAKVVDRISEKGKAYQYKKNKVDL